MPFELPDDDLLQLIDRARAGDESALGLILDQYRDQLRRLAEHELNQRLSARVDASDVVQQTFLSVCRRVNQFQGTSVQEFIGWLNQIHQHNIQDVARKHGGTTKRDVKREQQVNWSGISDGLEESSPSRHAIKNEQSLQLESLIQKLPIDQQTAVRMRHIDGKSLAEIAVHLGRSSQAIASLLKRGLENLRQISLPD